MTHFRRQFEFLNLGPHTGHLATVCVAFLILSKQIQSQCHDSFLAHPSQLPIHHHHQHHHHYLSLQPFVGFALSAKSLQVLLSLAASFQFLIFSFFRSSMTSSCHRSLGFPTGLVPIGFQSNSFPVGLARSILWICPSHLILCTLMNLTIPAPSID